MSTILMLMPVEEQDAQSKVFLGTVAAAKQLAELTNTTLVAGLFGAAGIPEAVQALAGAGFARVLVAADPALAGARYASDAAAAEALCRAVAAHYVVAPAVARVQRVLAGVTLRLRGSLDTNIVAFQPGPKAVRWFYRQRLRGIVERVGRPWFMSVDAGNFEPWTAAGGATPPVEKLELNLGPQRTVVTGFKKPPAEQQTIRPEAKLLFVAGAGWTKTQRDGALHVKEAEQLILDFTKKSRASLGSSKALTDQATEGQEVLPFLTHLNQVGQTGATPRHPKGLATCCFGEEPHVVGWRFVNQRRAVDLNAGCGWSQGKTDVLYVADAFEVMRELNALLKA